MKDGLYWFNPLRFEGEAGAAGGAAAGGSAGGAAGGSGAGGAGRVAVGNAAGGSGAGGAGGGSGAGGAGDGKPFTPPASQEDLDRIVEGRLARERAKYADYEEAKAKAKRLDDLEASQKTDIEKANERAAKAEAERLKGLTAANERLIRGEVKAAAAALGIVDPEAAFLLLDRSNVTVSDDGDVIGIEEALKALLKDRPFLAKPGAGGSADQGARSRSGPKDFRTASPDEFKAKASELGLRPRRHG